MRRSTAGSSPVFLDALIARHKGRRWTRALKAIVDRGGLGATITRSDFEAEFLRLLDDHGLPRPQSNAFVEGVEVDALWRSARLIVELDGRQARATATAFESDRARDRRLQARGYRVARITYRQLHDRPDAIADELRALLGWPVARLG